MRNYIRYIIYLYVFIGVSSATSGSYDEFFSAIQRDDSIGIRGLMNRGFDPNTVNPKGDYGLILALRAPSLKVVDALLESPLTQVEVRTPQDESPLMLAALRGYF